MPQSQRAPSVAVRLPNHFPYQPLLLRQGGFHQNTASLLAYLLRRSRYRINQEPAEQPLPHVRMKMLLQFRPGIVVAAYQKGFKAVAAQQKLEGVGKLLEMVHDLIFKVALAMSAI